MPAELLGNVRQYMGDMFNLFGFNCIGQSTSLESTKENSSHTEVCADVLLEFRAAIRAFALDATRSNAGVVQAGDVLQLCDALRDDVLPTLTSKELNADLAITQVVGTFLQPVDRQNGAMHVVITFFFSN